MCSLLSLAPWNLILVAETDHADSDCLLVAVLTHGEKGKIYAKDLGYPPDTLWAPFTGDQCSTLAGKPKIFFIQVRINSIYLL